MVIRLLQINNADSGWGAARAALRLHRSFDANSGSQVFSVLRVAQSKSGLSSVHGPVSGLALGWSMARLACGASLQRLQLSSNPVRHSCSWLPCRLDRALNVSPADLLHLHWVQEDMLSIEAIGRLRKPCVWTLHDTWAFCGSEHYPRSLEDQRFAQGYLPSNRSSDDRGVDLDRWCWQRKRRAWRCPIQLIAPSSWMADCVRRSALMHDWPLQVIPNALPVNTYRPWPRLLARQLFGLPQEAQLVLFGAVGGAEDPRKGWDLLAAALLQLVGRFPGLQAVVCGQAEPSDPPRLGLPVHYMGRLHDDQSLAMLYSAADVVVVPSRLDNLPQMATEAQSCGVPVVAFNCGGLPDVVQHQQTGYLARPFDTADLAQGIAWVLESAERQAQLGQAARQRAVQLWSPAVVVRQHRDLYEAVLAR